MTERLAALLHDADSHMHPVLSGYAPEPCDYHRAMARVLERQGVRVGDPPPPADDAGGLRAAAQALVDTAERTLPGHESYPLYLVRPVRMANLRAALAAQPAIPKEPQTSPELGVRVGDDGLDVERLARGIRAAVQLRLLAGATNARYSPTEIAEMVSAVIDQQLAAYEAER